MQFHTPLNTLQGINECSFLGVTCEKGAIVALELAEERVVGTLPEEVGLLSQLTTLDFADNFLEGPIPNFVYNNFPHLGKLLVVAHPQTIHIDYLIIPLRRISCLTFSGAETF